MAIIVAQGIVTTIRQTGPILPEQEDTLWEKEVLDSSSAKSLQNTVLVYACKMLGLRGCDEHCETICEQLLSTPMVREVRKQIKQNLPGRTTTDTAEQNEHQALMYIR